MRREIGVTIYNQAASGGPLELWHADKWPQGAEGAFDRAHALKGFLVTVRIKNGEDTVLRLTLDEALDLRDALDMVRHRSYQPSPALMARLKAGGKLTEDEI